VRHEGTVPEVSPGDFVLIHAGFALTGVDEAEAARAYEYLAQIGALGRITNLAWPAREPRRNAERDHFASGATGRRSRATRVVGLIVREP
jgi:hypothetical protein